MRCEVPEEDDGCESDEDEDEKAFRRSFDLFPGPLGHCISSSVRLNEDAGEYSTTSKARTCIITW